MTASLTKADGTYTPVGTLASYSLTHAATPADPRDTSGQIPTFSATLTDIQGDPKSLTGQNVELEDWTGSVSSGRVVSVNNGSANLADIDVSTIFERLNTTQTTLPMIFSEVQSVDPVAAALAHWMLMAGVTPEKLDGNLLHYIGGTYIGAGTFGYIADTISKFRFSGPPDSFSYFVPSAERNTPAIEVNPSQSVIIGGAFNLTETLSEIGINCDTQDTTVATFTLRRNGSTWTLREKLFNTAETVLITKTYTPVNNNNVVYAFAHVKKNAAAGKVDITLRIMELQDGTLNTVYSDTTATAVTSKLCNRPRPYRVLLGYDETLIGGHTVYGPPEAYFLIESSTLQATFPTPLYSISTAESVLTSEYKQTMPFKIPGFTGNVWEKMRELCSILDLDMAFEAGRIKINYRSAKRETLYDHHFIPALDLLKSGVSESLNDRETARSVEVLYRELLDSEADFASTLMWKADTVYSLEKGETKEELIQTDSSFVFLHQPIIVSGVPVPYTSPYSSYVITGHDGYIVDPQWWKDNGGSIKVYNTENSGEIKIKMQAPNVDTVRAPYRISEGAADRPALYVLGFGLPLDEPKTMKSFTGAEKAAQDVGVKFDSVFITKKIIAQNVAHKLATTFGTTESKLQFSVSQADQLAPIDSNTPLTPLADSVYWRGSYYRISDESITHGSISVNSAPRFNTIRVLNGEFATGKTIADWNALHANKKIRDTNVAPLPQYES